MNTKKLNEIADWLLDRVAAGQTEENGSMDWADFGKIHTTIMKDESGFIVWLDEYPIPDFTLTDRSTLNEIKALIAAA